MIVAGRAAADVRRAGGRLLLPHRDERELPAPGDARGARGRGARGHRQGDVPVPRGAAGSKKSAPGCSCWAPGRSCARSIAAADLLEQDWGVAADVWSAPSFTELARDGIDDDRWNMLHPTEEQRQSFVEASSWPGARRAGRRRDRLHAGLRRPDPAVRGRGATGCSAPTASAAPTTAKAPRSTSRSTATT